MRRGIYGPQPTAERPGDGLDNCASMLEALAELIGGCGDMSVFDSRLGNDASWGLFLLLTSISEGIRLSSEILHNEHIVRDRGTVLPNIVKEAEEKLARLKTVQEALTRLKEETS